MKSNDNESENESESEREGELENNKEGGMHDLPSDIWVCCCHRRMSRQKGWITGSTSTRREAAGRLGTGEQRCGETIELVEQDGTLHRHLRARVGWRRRRDLRVTGKCQGPLQDSVNGCSV